MFSETCGKVRHPDELTARAAAMQCLEKYGNAEALAVYQCPVCSGWHLTRRLDRRSALVVRDNSYKEV